MLQGVPCSKYALKEIAWGEKRSSERNGGRFMIDPFSRSVIRLTGQARSFQGKICRYMRNRIAAALYLRRETKS